MSLVFPNSDDPLVPGSLPAGGPPGHGPHHGHAPGAHPGCMFCNGAFDPEGSYDGDGAALSQHLALNDDCRQQWRIWKEQIVDEWGGD